MTDYTLYYKQELSLTAGSKVPGRWDVFLSAFMPNERTMRVFEGVDATHKWWLLCPEYHFGQAEFPTVGKIYQGVDHDEAVVISGLWNAMSVDPSRSRLCV